MITVPLLYLFFEKFGTVNLYIYITLYCSHLINSKSKGKNYELEVCKTLKDLSYQDVKRSVQYCGNNTDSNNANVICLDGIHIECKAL